jgi:predicted 3-demethylubiquinone-9 3-methyltransferase (glyoxalase superfamily)
LTKEGQEGHCGWCKDQFGFSWQVIPENLHELMADPVKSSKVAACFRTMKKMDYNQILSAANS